MVQNMRELPRRKNTSGISHVHKEVQCSNWLGTVWLY